MKEEKNIEMINLYKSGNKEILSDIISDNMGLVMKATNLFKNKRLQGLEIEDLIQTGILGLIKSVKNFNPDMGYKFSTYAYPYIVGTIKTTLEKDSVVKIPLSDKVLIGKILYLENTLPITLGRNVTDTDIANELNISVQRVSSLKLASLNESLDQYVSSDIDIDKRLVDFVSSCNTPSQDDIISRIELRDAIQKLNQKEMSVIVMNILYGYTQKDISSKLRLSQASISRILNSAIDQLRSIIK